MTGEEQAHLRSVLSCFPRVEHAFAYGSGVFAQPGLYDAPSEEFGGPAAAAAAAGGGSRGGDSDSDNASAAVAAGTKDRPMLDFIFAVEDTVAWHTENLRRHPHHYSFLRHLGPAALAAVAERLGAGVYFNTLVPWDPHQLIKYGVVRLSALQQDLLHWTTLYCAGRLHKPVATLQRHPAVAAAQDQNLLSALRLALLLLPPKFGTLDLLHAICAISYSGDVRMGLAEDSKKVHRIVAGSEAGLRRLYAAPLQAAQQHWQLLQPAAEAGGDAWVCDHSPAAVTQLASSLPGQVLERLVPALGLPPLPPLPVQHPNEQQQNEQQRAEQQLQAVGRALAALDPGRRQRLLRHAIHAIVGASSRRQAVSGVLTAGLAKSVRYGLAKLRKAWR